jgi:outer membrane lipoprotein carrier protein
LSLSRSPCVPTGGRPVRGARSLLTVLALSVLSVLSLAPAGAAGPGEVLKDYLTGLNTLSSDFEQVTFNADHSAMAESSGVLSIKRPGKFRWEYKKPGEQIIIADGKRVYVYDVELEQVSHQDQAKALAGTPALLLADGGPIDREFRVKDLPSADGMTWVELTPKAEDTEVQEIRIGFEGKELRSLIMEDSFGQMTRLLFAGTKRNTDLPDDLFRLKPNKATDILQFD